MKIIEKILDNYYCNILIRVIKRIAMSEAMFLDYHIQETSTTIELLAKPDYYKYYTLIYVVQKKDALLKIIEIKDVEEYLHNKIKSLDENNAWNKGEII